MAESWFAAVSGLVSAADKAKRVTFSADIDTTFDRFNKILESNRRDLSISASRSSPCLLLLKLDRAKYAPATHPTDGDWSGDPAPRG